jgi:hypothetical protein
MVYGKNGGHTLTETCKFICICVMAIMIKIRIKVGYDGHYFWHVTDSMLDFSIKIPEKSIFS